MSEYANLRQNRCRTSVAVALAGVLVASACTNEGEPTFPPPQFSDMHAISSEAWNMLQHLPVGAEVATSFDKRYTNITGTIDNQKWTVQLSSFGASTIPEANSISDVHIMWSDGSKPPSELHIIQDHPDGEDPIISMVEATVTSSGDLAVIESSNEVADNKTSVYFQRAKCSDIYSNAPPRDIPQALFKGTVEALSALEHGVLPSVPITSIPSIPPEPGDNIMCHPGF